jgi:Oxidoreductase-like protein, N-terminal
MQESAFIQQLDAQLSKTKLQIAATNNALIHAKKTHRAAPTQPTTCCGRGCNGCVWESWYAAVQYWQEQADQLFANSKP